MQLVKRNLLLLLFTISNPAYVNELEIDLPRSIPKDQFLETLKTNMYNIEKYYTKIRSKRNNRNGYVDDM